MTEHIEETAPAIPPTRLHLPTLRAITIWQPWATLMAIGAKQYETRSWPTTYRGVTAIHAARRIPAEYRDGVARIFASAAVQAALEAANHPAYDGYLDDMPSGILAVGRLTGCHRSNRTVRTFIQTSRGDAELTFGDFTDGRWIHEYEYVVPLQEPVPCRGLQQFWDVSQATTEIIARQLAPLFPKIDREIRRTLEPYTR